MNILYCGNDKTEDGLLISILSLLKNAGEPLHIYLLTMSLGYGETVYFPISDTFAGYADRLVKQADPDNFVVLIDVTGQFYRELPVMNLGTRFTPYCMLRLFADEIPELPEKILYLDNDVVCRTSCGEFYRQDISAYEFAGVLDHYGRWFFRRHFLRFDYQNSGVLLMNLKKIRETGLLRRCRKLCTEKKMFMPDQSALNKLAVSKKTCPRRFNEQRKLHKDTVLQHFTTSFRFFPWLHAMKVKPWEIEKVHRLLKIHEYDELFDEYRRRLSEIRTVKPNIN
ncbi:MAG TPA: glycosyltransferase [Bacillota bacterium]|nr:glycosyltransferase [Bacillota bacterium]